MAAMRPHWDIFCRVIDNYGDIGVCWRLARQLANEFGQTVRLWVDDLARAVEWMTANGVRFAPGGIRKGAAGFDICFIHPKGNDQFPIGGEGVLIELVQAPPEVVAALG